MANDGQQCHFVLSIAPLAALRRDEISGTFTGTCEFRDLATERRGGLRKLFGSLRRYRYTSAVVIAEPDEFFFAGDMLSALCLIVRADSHHVMVRGRQPRMIRSSSWR